MPEGLTAPQPTPNPVSKSQSVTVDRWRTVEDVQPILDAAIALLLAGKCDAAVKLVQPVVFDVRNTTSPINRLSQWGEWGRIANILEAIVARQESLRSPADRLAVRLVLGTAYERLHDYASATPHLALALLMARTLGDMSAEGFILNRQGLVMWAQGDLSTALKLYAQALPLVRHAGNHTVEGRLLNSIAVVYGQMGKFAIAATYFEQAWRIAQRERDAASEASYAGNIVEMLVRLGEYASALRFVEGVLAQTQRAGNTLLLITLLIRQGECFLQQEQLAEAKAAFAQVVELAQTFAAPDEHSVAHAFLADVALRNSDLPTAQAERDAALAVYDRTEPDCLMPTLHICGKVAEAESKIDEAKQFYAQVYDIAIANDAPPRAAEIELEYARLATAESDSTAALDHVLRAYALVDDSEHCIRKRVVAALRQMSDSDTHVIGTICETNILTENARAGLLAAIGLPD